MPTELLDAVGKGPVHQMTTRTLADALAGGAITASEIHPLAREAVGPLPMRDRLRSAFPAGRWDSPDEIACLGDRDQPHGKQAVSRASLGAEDRTQMRERPP
jgi:hypothetical protein